MKDIFRNAVYLFKSMYRDIGFTFWELIYPIVLISFFYIAFTGITDRGIETINVGIDKDSSIITILETVDVLYIVETPKDDIERSLEKAEISGYVDKDLNLLVNKSGLDETILKRILDQVKQSILLQEPLEKLDFGVDYLKDDGQEANGIFIIFYSLIAMVSTYGLFPGIEITNISQANLTPLGARINTTPIKKSTLLTSGLIVGLFMNIASNTILLFFIMYILKLNIIRNLGYSLLIILFGNLFGITLGIFIGCSNKKSQGFKNMLSIGTTLILSFLAGLMNPDIKVLIDKKIPIVGKLNPISIITNNLYRINILNNTSDLNSGILLLVLYSSILLFASYVFLRRRQYDSI